MRCFVEHCIPFMQLVRETDLNRLSLGLISASLQLKCIVYMILLFLDVLIFEKKYCLH